MVQTTNEAPLNNIIKKVGSYWIHATPPVIIRCKSALKISTLVTPVNISEHIQMGDTRNTTILPPEFSYNKNFLEKILLYAAVARRFSITIDTNINYSLNVHLQYVTRIKFKQYSG